MNDLLPIDLQDQIAEVARELKLRESVYPRWIAAKRLTQEKADRQIAVMRAVLETLRRARGVGGVPSQLTGGHVERRRALSRASQ